MDFQFSKQIPLEERFDVLVAGGGPAGCAAAIAAARNGASVLLVEASGTLGGMGTTGLVPAWAPFSDGKSIVYRGIAQEIFELSKSCMQHVKPDATDWVALDAEALKRIYDKLVRDSGATVLFHTHVADVVREGARIDVAVLANKSGLTACRAKCYIDCTGDADVVAFAGFPYLYGDEQTGGIQPTTLCFTLTNVDEYHYKNWYTPENKMTDVMVALYHSDKYPLVTDNLSCNSLVGPRTVGFNCGHLWDVKPTDPYNLSTALMQGRELAYQIWAGVCEQWPDAFASSFLVSTAQMLGVRESRRIVGEYTLTAQDYLQKKSFPDEIGRNSYYMDVHLSKEESDLVLEGKKTFEEFDKGRASYAPGESHGIPYRSLIPKGAENLLVAGRIISCDHQLQGSVRVMPICLVTGQAAGTAAAMAVQCGAASKVDPEELRTRLLQDGVYFM